MTVFYAMYSIVTELDDTETETSFAISIMAAPLGPTKLELVEAYASAIVRVPKSGMEPSLPSSYTSRIHSAFSSQSAYDDVICCEAV